MNCTSARNHYEPERKEAALEEGCRQRIWALLKIPVQYVISETEDHTAGRTTQAPKTKVSLVKVIFIVVLALALGSMQRVNTSSPREGGVPFLCISSLLAAPKGVKGVKEEKDLSEGLLDRKAGLVGKTALAMTRIRTIPTKRGTSEA